MAAACAALVFLGCRGEPPPAAPPRASAPPPAWVGTIVALGDSLTAGYGLAESEAWPALLERRLAAEGRRWRVVNSGVSGETSSGALARVDWVLQQLRPDVVILETGANDGLRGIAPGLVQGNLLAAGRRLQAGGATVVLAGMRMLRNLGDEYTRDFEAIYPAAAAEIGAVRTAGTR